MMNSRYDLTEVIGRWPGVFQSFGVSVRDDGKHGPCPLCGGKDRFRFDNKEGKGTWICNQCGAGDGWEMIKRVLHCEFKDAVTDVMKIIGSVPKQTYTTEGKVNPSRLRRMFKESIPAFSDGPVMNYLRARGLSLRPEGLRFHPKCWDPETKREHPAMLAIVRLPDGEAVTIHRTYLFGAAKAKMEKPKKLMPGLKKLSGAAIRLFPIKEDGIVGIAEGLETAIACTELFKIPTWAAISSTILMNFVPPLGVHKVCVFGDNDMNYTGQKAAYMLANRLVIQKKIDTDVYIPKTKDWLDQLNEQAHAPEAGKE